MEILDFRLRGNDGLKFAALEITSAAPMLGGEAITAFNYYAFN